MCQMLGIIADLLSVDCKAFTRGVIKMCDNSLRFPQRRSVVER